MKKILIIPFILLCIMLFAVPACAMENEPDNFRGIPWGAKLPNNFEDNEWGLLVSRGRIQESTIYLRMEDFTFGEAKFRLPIQYHFHDSKGFVGAFIEKIEGDENVLLAYKACIENWGKPDAEGVAEDYPIVGCDTLSSIWEGEHITVLTQFRLNTPGNGFLIIGEIEYILSTLKVKEKNNFK